MRELRADGNRITSLDGLQKLEALRKLSVQGNLIEEVDLSGFRWWVSTCAAFGATMTWHAAVGHG